MSTTDNDGGPAFPVMWQDRGGMVAVPGMTLRDWFAGQALVGLLSGQYKEQSHHNLTEIPAEAYLIADAMLEAREKGGK